MKLIEADRIVGKAFPGKYRSVRLELVTYHTGEIMTDCRVYVEGSKCFTAPTFQAAIDKLLSVVEEIDNIDDGEEAA